MLKDRERVLNESFVGDGVQVLVSCEVIFVDLVGLFEQTLFDLKQVAVIPGKDGDLAGWVGYFADDAHCV